MHFLFPRSLPLVQVVLHFYDGPVERFFTPRSDDAVRTFVIRDRLLPGDGLGSSLRIIVQVQPQTSDDLSLVVPNGHCFSVVALFRHGSLLCSHLVDLAHGTHERGGMLVEYTGH